MTHFWKSYFTYSSEPRFLDRFSRELRQCRYSQFQYCEFRLPPLYLSILFPFSAKFLVIITKYEPIYL